MKWYHGTHYNPVRNSVFYLNGYDKHEFLLWAFGPGYEDLQSRTDFMNQWNLNHSDKKMLEGNSQIKNDIPEMIRIWRENKDGCV